MVNGHGDDLHAYGGEIDINFSSNVAGHPSHARLWQHLSRCWPQAAHYPEPDSHTAEAELAAWLHVDEEEVMLTNGATEAIYLMAEAARGRRAAVAEPTFSEYHDACRMHGVEVNTLFGGAEALERNGGEAAEAADLVWLCNPNNPTGDVVPLRRLTALVDAHPDTLFVVDQSYEAFTLERVFAPADAVRRHNLLLIRSMTKQFCLPGMRLGYVIGAPHLIRRLRRLRQPWAVGTLQQEAARYLIRHEADYAFDVEDILNERARVEAALQHAGAIATHPSQTHILLCQLRTGRADALKEDLARRHRLLIRDASNFKGLTPGHFRIAVQGREAASFVSLIISTPLMVYS